MEYAELGKESRVKVEDIKELRKTNFKLGFNKESFNTVYKSTHRDFSNDPRKVT